MQLVPKAVLLCLNKENYVSWSSRLLRYAKSGPNGKLIHNSIINDPYVRRMIPELEADDQAIQTIILGLPEDIYAVVESCETAQEIWLRVQQMMKGSDIGIQEKKAKLFNEWERFTSNEGESIESYYHRFLKLMNDLKRNKHFPEKIASNLKQIAQPGVNMGQDRKMQMVGGNGENQFRQYAGHNVGNLNGYNAVQNVRNQVAQNPRVQNVRNQKGLIGVLRNGNQNENGNLVAARAEPRRRDAAYLQTQLLIAQKEEAEIQLQTEEFDLMADATDLDEIKEVNANCILMANLQQASTSGTQTDKAPVYDSDGSAEVHNYENCYDNEIFNMFTQEEQYTELLKLIPKQLQVQQNDNNVISEVTSVEQSGETVEQHPANFEETHLNNQLSKEKSTVSFLLEEKKKLKSDFKTRKDELLDKQIQLEKKIKELNNIFVKTGQSIQTIHMLSPKPDLFYHTEQKMALGYQNPFYLKQAQKKQQSLYDRKVLLEKHDPPVVHDSEETLQTHNWSSSAHQELHKIVKVENFPIVNQVDTRVKNFEIQFLKEATKFVGDFKSLAKEDDASLAKHKTLELEIERLLRAVVSQDIMSFVQNNSVVDTSNLQTELERTKERFENCIIKKENEYAKLWNDWYKKCDECKYDKISYDKAYKDMQQKIEQFQAQLGDLKGKSKDTSCVSDTLNPLSQKIENENVELEFQVLNYARENTHLKATYKNLFDSIYVNNPFKTSREEKHVPNNVRASARTKLITASQPRVFTKKDVNSDSNGLSFTGIDNTKTRRPQLRSNTKNDRVPSASKSSRSKNKDVEVEEHHRNLLLSKNTKHMSSACNNIKLDSQNVISKVVCTMCCSKHMTENLKLLINFVWKFMGIVCFRNDHVAAILGFGQFCDSDIKVAFRRNACFVKNLEGVDLLKGDRSTSLYTINLYEMASASLICLMARASSTNKQGKSKRASHPPKPVPNSRQRLHLLHMDLCGPIRIVSINGKWYVLVIVDDYSRYTWEHFLRSKDEAPEVIKTFLKRITVLLQSPVIIRRTDNST
nr:hypothetical protein [Tanacetum cinerariifolium]